MKILIQLSLLLFFGVIFLMGCAPEEKELDLRGPLSGTYSYTKTSYHNNGIISETGTLQIALDPEDTEKLIVMEEETFYGYTLDAVDSFLIFNIPEQKVMEKTDEFVTIAGVDNVNIGGVRGAASYFPKKNRLRLYYQVAFKEKPLLNYTVSLLAEKQSN